ncbi:MAG: anti-sigma factor family protein [Bacillota bacterium]
MCFDEGYIQSYIDGEIQGREAEELQDHINACEDCRAIYNRLLDNDMLVRSSMEGFIASDRERFNAELAWSKLKLETNKYEEKQKGKWFKTMWYKRLATAAAVIGFVALIGLSPVSSMAGNFLTIFRVEKVKPITITHEDMTQLDRIMKDGTGGVDIKNFGKIEVRGEQGVRQVNLAEARNSVDFDLKIPAIEGYGGPVLKKTPATSVIFSLDVDKVNLALEAFGSKERLPQDLNGKEFTLVVPSGITAEYSGQAGSIMLAQSRGPSVLADPGVDPNTIRQALLSIPALPENIKRQLMAVNDWQHTVLVPVMDGQYSEVKVNGNDGVFVHGGGSDKNYGALVWQNGGVISVLAGEGLNAGSAVGIASGIK